LKPLLSGERSRKLIKPGSQNTAPNKRLVSGGLSRRRHQRLSESVTFSSTKAEWQAEFRQRLAEILDETILQIVDAHC
jgi:hypothetical protein